MEEDLLHSIKEELVKMNERINHITERLSDTNDTLKEIKDAVKQQQQWYWKILLLTICGAFALVGVKLFV
jgi:predicted  nucleic acid-binding Zn-ribbon protein